MAWRWAARVLGRPFAIADRERDACDARDAIVVLGATLGPRDALTPVLAERVAAAALLFAAGAAPCLIATGGVTGRAHRAEADVIADALVAAGVPREVIVVEDRAQTTHDNARLTAALVAAHDRAARVWLVTQPFHARRAEYLFRAAGLDARAWHIADSLEYRDHRRATCWYLREYASWLKVLSRR
ncbi:MAG: YdcF family protein [Kofleriaceae bacterium]